MSFSTSIPRQRSAARGTSLVEAIVAIGVLAVAVPLVFATLANSGESGMSAQAETRCSWMVPTCLAELQATRAGNSRFLPATRAGEAFPSAGEVMALGFSVDGRPLGALDMSAYEAGVREIGGEPVRFISAMSGRPVESSGDETPLLHVRITLEYPAAAPAAKRRKLDFHTRMP